MTSVWIWAVMVTAGVAAAVLGASTHNFGLHLGVTALACAAFAIVAVWERHRLMASGANAAALAGSTAYHMGLIWAWGALSLLLIYLFILDWGEWWQYVLGAGVVACLCFFFSTTLARDAAAGRHDDTMLQLARYLALGQLAGMVVAMIGLVLDHKMPRNPHVPDWAANNIFFFGAAALAAVSAYALWSAPPEPKRS